jgi:hypothetical protein
MDLWLIKEDLEKELINNSNKIDFEATVKVDVFAKVIHLLQVKNARKSRRTLKDINFGFTCSGVQNERRPKCPLC